MELILNDISYKITRSEDVDRFLFSLNSPEKWLIQIADILTKWFDNKDQFTIYTSGSTGEPKLISISKRAMVLSAHKTINYFGLHAGITAALCLPAAAIAGAMMLVRALVGDWRLVLMRPAVVLSELSIQPFDFVAMTPMQMDATLSNDDKALNQCTKIILGGAPVPTSLLAKVKSLPTLVYQTYGMTETITHVAVQRINGDSPDKFFHAIEGVRFTVDDDHALIIEADHLDESPIITNDIVELYDNERFRWLGRRDFIVNSGGLKLNPESIESKLSPLITKPFFLIGEADEKLGYRLVMLVESEEDDINVDEMVGVLDTKLSKNERPKLIYRVSKFRLTANNKIKRQLENYPKRQTLWVNC